MSKYLKYLKIAAIALAIPLAVGAGFVLYSSYRTEATLDAHREKVKDMGRAASSPVYVPGMADQLPAPVARYFAFVFPEPPRPINYVAMEMAGKFRRPRTEGFAPTTATQVASVGRPSLVFAANTSVLPGLWAVAYDAYIDGRMEMKAKILSTLTVVDEYDKPALNKSSLRRWLIESPLYPSALLPGGPVQWEPIDENRARAHVSAYGIETSVVAVFGPDGSLRRFDAEEDGDLGTPYHGSGEHVLRGDYQRISGMMIPLSFTIARAAAGRIYPFWIGKIKSIEFDFKH